VDTESRYDITEIYDKSGYSPLHFAAYKNSERMAEILMEFVIHIKLYIHCYRYLECIKITSPMNKRKPDNKS
jgi:hypothetical protein